MSLLTSAVTIFPTNSELGEAQAAEQNQRMLSAPIFLTRKLHAQNDDGRDDSRPSNFLSVQTTRYGTNTSTA